MIQQIISDAKAMEAEAIRSEEDAQKAYEDFVKETNNSIEAKSKDIVNKSEMKAKAETDHVEAKEAKEGVLRSWSSCQIIMLSCSRAATSCSRISMSGKLLAMRRWKP